MLEYTYRIEALVNKINQLETKLNNYEKRKNYTH